jgi:hypothetical protein
MDAPEKEPNAKRGGRPKGAPNKVTAAAKDNVLAVFIRLGGSANMAKWARENQTEFYKIYARLIPIDTNHSGSLNVNYTPIPTEQRDIDSMARAAGAATDGNPSQPH